MSSIGDVQFDLMRGQGRLFAERVETWVVAGLAGLGAQRMGQGDAPYRLMTVYFAEDLVDADGHIDACRALQGTLVEIYDAFGDFYDGVLVKMVDDTDAKHPVIWQGENAIRVQLIWEMEKAY